MPSRGFGPVADATATTLLLGSLPGTLSIARHQYYAQPRNAFWRIVEALFAIPLDQPYDARLRSLTDHRIALWDVCASAHRPGSLDADIDRATVVVNDFQGFFAAHPRITRIFFNGATAAALYRRLVLPRLSDPHRHLETRTLPSTSPAHARLSYEAKLDAWRSLLD
ncbi:MAG: DNA-deoxyinosine glycosylase [Burkholderiales bacterium]